MFVRITNPQPVQIDRLAISLVGPYDLRFMTNDLVLFWLKPT